MWRALRRGAQHVRRTTQHVFDTPRAVLPAWAAPHAAQVRSFAAELPQFNYTPAKYTGPSKEEARSLPDRAFA